jgi:hypothetical protein
MGQPLPKPPLVDFNPEKNPHQHRQAVQSIAAVFRTTHPAVREKGADWYKNVHQATEKGIRGSGLDIHQGAGLVAAVSPNMDWEKNNIDALPEIRSLKRADWHAIEDSEANRKYHTAMAHRAAGAGDEEAAEHHRMAAQRTPEANSALQGMSIQSATTSGLLKAKRIIDGEPVNEVLPRRTAPKTNAFAHNIAHPDEAGPVTIDGRAHDIAANRMQGWEQGRGIGSADLKRGTSRYEHIEQAYRGATQAIAQEHGIELLPHQVQAVTWEGGKKIEMSGTTKAGQPRKVGVRRAGQPYV